MTALKQRRFQNVSFFMPAYNCAETVQESVESIMDGNFSPGDELVIVNDGSSDNTEEALQELVEKYPEIRIFTHSRNKGGGAARNTAIEHCRHSLLFCLDSDNILVPRSIPKLKKFLEDTGADAAAFQELYYFQESKEIITHKWTFNEGVITLADCLTGSVTPGASGNYMFTKESWLGTGGYPEFTGALDTWGFAFWQLATGSKMRVMPDSFYYHRYGHDSYWMRDKRSGDTSLKVLQLIIPFLALICENDIDYMMSREGRYTWFEQREKRPIRLQSGVEGRSGVVVGADSRQHSLPVRAFRKLKHKLLSIVVSRTT